MQIEIKEGIVYCDGISLGITTEQIQDYQIQSGHSVEYIIDYCYKNSKSIQREKKLGHILN